MFLETEQLLHPCLGWILPQPLKCLSAKMPAVT